MKIAIINTWKQGAVHNIMEPLARSLNDYEDVECDYFTIRDDFHERDFDSSFEDYDLVHVGYIGNLLSIRNECLAPTTISVHHIPAHRLAHAVNALNYCRPVKIITPDPFLQRQLGQMNVNGVELIPYAFDHSGFKELPYPEEFSVGFLGCDSEAKRFFTIERACKELGVKCVGIDRNTKNEEVDFLPQEKIMNMYREMSVYVSAGWNDGGPLPPQEALLCGRPVISTRVGMMPSIIKPGWNGEFFDGSVEDLKKKIMMVKNDLPDLYNHGARQTYIPTLNDVVPKWYGLFKRLVEEQE
jgi:glycosyltransferase involved in cell wall biosynthesis